MFCKSAFAELLALRSPPKEFPDMRAPFAPGRPNRPIRPGLPPAQHSARNPADSCRLNRQESGLEMLALNNAYPPFAGQRRLMDLRAAHIRPMAGRAPAVGCAACNR